MFLKMEGVQAEFSVKMRDMGYFLSQFSPLIKPTHDRY